MSAPCMSTAAHHDAGQVSPDEPGAAQVRVDELRSLQLVGPGDGCHDFSLSSVSLSSVVECQDHTGSRAGQSGVPSSSRRRKPASSSTGTPSSLGLVGLGPGVLAHHDVVGLLRHRPGGLAARGRGSPPWPRRGENPSSDPVTTTVSPSRVRGAGLVDLVGHPHPGRRPTCRRSPACQSTANHSRTASAIDAADALDGGQLLAAGARGSPSIVREVRRPARAPRSGPTCRIDSATSTRHSGWCLGLLEVGEQLGAVGRQHPAVDDGLGRVGLLRGAGEQRDVGEHGARCRRPRGRGRTGRPRRRCTPAVEQGGGALPAERLDVEARRGRPGGTAARAAGPGRSGVLGQRMSLSPSFSGRERRAARGAVGRHDERALGAVAQVDDRARRSRG